MLAMALVAGCPRPQVPPVTAADAERAAARWPGTEQGDLESGRSLFIAHCSGCHLPPVPASVPPAAWPEQVEQMRERAHLSVENAALVTRYLIMVASRPAPPAQQSPPRR